jgi:ABC-type uncharacterized transport system auxiliary subunit
MTTRRLALVQLACVTAGCSSLLGPGNTPATAALIDALPERIPKAARTRGVLFVSRPSCRAAYDTTRMAYRVREHELAYFADHEWAERPAQMLHPLIVRTLGQTACCTAVIASPVARHDVIVNVDIRELVQDFSVDPPRLRLALGVVVVADGRTLAAHDIERAVAMRATNAEAGAAAANTACAQALEELAAAVISATSS